MCTRSAGRPCAGPFVRRRRSTARTGGGHERARPANAELSCEARLDEDRRPWTPTYKAPRFVSFSDRWTDALDDHDSAGHHQAGGAVAGRVNDDRDAARDVLQLAGPHGP
jgi:hypothetical protein